MRGFPFQDGQARLALVVALGLLVSGCGDNEAPDDDLTSIRAPEIARIVPAQEALAGANIPTLDPAPMNDAEVRKALGAGPLCEFRYTKAGRPVLAAGMQPNGIAASGIVKLSGNLVPLTSAAAGETDAPPGAILLLADPVRVAVAPAGNEEAENDEGVQSRAADMIFEIGQSLRVGYRGYLVCGTGSLKNRQ